MTPATIISMQDVTRIAHDASPHDLDADQANPTTGKISWPVILQGWSRFIEDRDEVENLYRSRANSGKFDAESYLAFNKSCETLLHTLKANIGEFSATDYQQARHFVENLCVPLPNLPGIDFWRLCALGRLGRLSSILGRGLNLRASPARAVAMAPAAW